MVVWQDFLTSSPQVCGGEICATGTRIPVTVILDNLAEGAHKGRNLEELSLTSHRPYQRRSRLRRGIGARGAPGADPNNMKSWLDENLPAELVTDFRGLGYDADTVAGEGLCGAADPTVADAARAADRILFKLDKGIANPQRYLIHQHAGVVLFRPDTSGQSAVTAFVRERLSKVLELDLNGR